MTRRSQMARADVFHPSGSGVINHPKRERRSQSRRLPSRVSGRGKFSASGFRVGITRARAGAVRWSAPTPEPIDGSEMAGVAVRAASLTLNVRVPPQRAESARIQAIAPEFAKLLLVPERVRHGRGRTRRREARRAQSGCSIAVISPWTLGQLCAAHTIPAGAWLTACDSKGFASSPDCLV